MGSEGELHLIALHGEDDVTIREYRDGDDLRRIHWPATARTGDLMVRQEDRPAQRRAVVLLDPVDAHGGSGATGSFEWAVSACASIAAHLCESGYAVHLVCPETVDSGRVADTLQIDEILDVLAILLLRPKSTDDLLLRAAQGLAARRLRRRDRRSARPRGDRPARQPAPARPRPVWPWSWTPVRSGRPRSGWWRWRNRRPGRGEPHVDALRLAGWRAVPVGRDEDVPRGRCSPPQPWEACDDAPPLASWRPGHAAAVYPITSLFTSARWLRTRCSSSG